MGTATFSFLTEIIKMLIAQFCLKVGHSSQNSCLEGSGEICLILINLLTLKFTVPPYSDFQSGGRCKLCYLRIINRNRTYSNSIRNVPAKPPYKQYQNLKRPQDPLSMFFSDFSTISTTSEYLKRVHLANHEIYKKPKKAKMQDIFNFIRIKCSLLCKPRKTPDVRFQG